MRNTRKVFSYLSVTFLMLVGCSNLSSLETSQASASVYNEQQLVNEMATLVGVEMAEMPYKTEYFINETINPVGAKLRVMLSDGQTYLVDIDYPMIKQGIRSFGGLGTQEIVVDYGYNGQHQEVKFNVEVIDNQIYVEDIGLETEYIEIFAGQNYYIKTSATPIFASDPSLEFWSLDANIASVDETGLITANATGLTVIKVESHDKKCNKQIIIYVKQCDSPLASVTLIRSYVDQLYQKITALQSLTYTLTNLALIEAYRVSGVELLYQAITEKELSYNYAQVISNLDSIKPEVETTQQVAPIQTIAVDVANLTELELAITNEAVDTINFVDDITGNLTIIRSAATDLIINFEDYVFTGDFDLTANNLTTLTLNGTANPYSITGDLRVSALLASVYNNLDIGGTITINGVSDSTWYQNGSATQIDIVDDGAGIELVGGTIINGLFLKPNTGNNVIKLKGALNNLNLVVEKTTKLLFDTMTPPLKILILPDAGATEINNNQPSVPLNVEVTVNDPLIALSVPIIGEAPSNSLVATLEYTATVSWDPSDNPFEQKVYTATIILTPKPGFTLEGLPADFFAVSGAISVTNSFESGTVTVVFPEAVLLPDTTAPLISNLLLYEIKDISSYLDFDVDEDGTYYYLVLLATDLAPDAATIKLQGSAITKGSGAVNSGANEILISGLATATAYKLYIIVEDGALNTSEVGSIDLNTAILVTHQNCLLIETPTLINVTLSTAIQGLVKANFLVTKNSADPYTDFTISGGDNFYTLNLGVAAVPGDVFTVTIIKDGYYFRGNAILLATPNQTSVSAYSAQISFSHNKEGTYYYLVKLLAEAAPEAQQIKDHVGSTIFGAGSAVIGNNAFTVTNLAADTQYKIYLVVEEHIDSETIFSNVICGLLTTPPAATTAGILSVLGKDDYILGTQSGTTPGEAISAEISVPNIVTTLLLSDIVGTSIDVLLYNDAAFTNSVASMPLAVGNTIAYIKVTSTVEPVFSKYYAVTITRSAGTAVMTNATILGTVGVAITTVEFTVTLTNDTFKLIAKNSNLLSWIKNIPAGLTVKNPDKVNNGKNSVILSFAGTPSAGSLEPLEITITGTFLNSGIDLVVTANPNTKFQIS